MLTPDQREYIETGEIREKSMMQRRIRENLSDTMVDINFALDHHSMIEGRAEIEDTLNHSAMARLMNNLLYLIDERYIDDNLLWMLVEQAEETWTVPGSQHVHGEKEELVIDIFTTVFDNFNPESDMDPEVDQLEGWDELVEMVEQLDD